jgi:heat-inducible transcriptional repressor
MSVGLTTRQKEILFAIIEQHSVSAEAIGSNTITEHFDISPATVRSEMAILEHTGYLYQPHISAGRLPTDKAYRLYVNSIEKPNLHKRRSDSINKKVMSHTNNIKGMVKMATNVLSETTNSMAFSVLSGDFYSIGLNNLFSQPEIAFSEKISEVARFIDSLQEWIMLSEIVDVLSIYIGHENPVVKTSGLTTVIAKFHTPLSEHNYIGAIGPVRIDYQNTLATVAYIGQTLEKELMGEN